MQKPCNYCGNNIEDSVQTCPFCGAVNDNYISQAAGGFYGANGYDGNSVPRTIQELQIFCGRHNLTPEKTHFHIGDDYRGPKAFGIYQDMYSGNFVVYKNKSDGQRAIRYEGPDEAYAVNEIFQKMREIAGSGTNIPGKSMSKSMSTSADKKYSLLSMIISAGIIVGVIVLVFVLLKDDYNSGYYYYNDDYYYSNGNDWYVYDYYQDSWEPYDEIVNDAVFINSYNSYSSSWDYNKGTSYSEYYNLDSSYSSDDYDSWSDSDGFDSYSDWDSDW